MFEWKNRETYYTISTKECSKKDQHKMQTPFSTNDGIYFCFSLYRLAMLRLTFDEEGNRYANLKKHKHGSSVEISQRFI
jgi:hypothetical protein